MASDIFAKLGDIKGESLDDKHKDEIEVLSWSWGVTNAVTLAGTGAGQGKASFQRSLVHAQDRQGVTRIDASVRDRRAPEGSDDHAPQGREGPTGVPRHQDERRDRHRADQDADSNDGESAESVSLAFAKIDVAYRPQKADGSLDAGIHFKYDLKANKEA